MSTFIQEFPEEDEEAKDDPESIVALIISIFNITKVSSYTLKSFQILYKIFLKIQTKTTPKL